MNDKDLLEHRRAKLTKSIVASSGDKLHLDAFVARLTGPDQAAQLSSNFTFTCPTDASTIRYEGFPRISHIGFGLGAGTLDASTAGTVFLESISRLQQRQGQMLQSLISDDIALLGLADGLAHVKAAGINIPNGATEWLIHLVDSSPGSTYWLNRVRQLAGDVLDGRGRLRTSTGHSDVDSQALEFVLRDAWPQAFVDPQRLDEDYRAQLLGQLLSLPAPRIGEIERAVVWLRAIDALALYTARHFTPSVSDTVRILQDVQHALKRWRADDRPRRQGVRVGTWLIDDEYDVQTLLWAILYPIFGSGLVDETYLPNWGFTAPRLDLGITSLNIIIEAKIARIPSDFKKIEGEIHADLGLYFKDPSAFDRMIVFIYDDCDKHEPETIDGLKNALLNRDRIEGVVVVRRPSVMPARNSRA